MIKVLVDYCFRQHSFSMGFKYNVLHGDFNLTDLALLKIRRGLRQNLSEKKKRFIFEKC